MIIAWILAGTAAWAAPQKLSTLVQMAEPRQLEWQEAITARKKAEENIYVQRSKFLPDLSLNSSYDYDWQKQSRNQESVGSSASILSSWSIYDNGTSLREYEIGKLELLRAREDEHAAREEAAYGILTRYAQYLLTRREHEINERKLGMLRNQYRLVERQFRQGQKTRRDYQRLQAELERAQLNLMRLSDGINDSFQELVRFVGDPSLLPSIETLELMKTDNLLAALLKKAGSTAPDERAPTVKSAKANLDIQKVRVREARTGLWPQINLNAEAGYGSDGFARTGERWSDNERVFAAAGVQFKWTLFDWWGKPATYHSALFDSKFAEQSYDQALLNLRTDFEKQRRQIERQRRSLQVVRDIFAIERKTYSDIEDEYRDGRASYLDLITSLDRQAQAETDLEQEINQYILVLAQTMKLSGDLYAAIASL
jgi:outer membrane protein TolC